MRSNNYLLTIYKTMFCKVMKIDKLKRYFSLLVKVSESWRDEQSDGFPSSSLHCRLYIDAVPDRRSRDISHGARRPRNLLVGGTDQRLVCSFEQEPNISTFYHLDLTFENNRKVIKYLLANGGFVLRTPTLRGRCLLTICFISLKCCNSSIFRYLFIYFFHT